MKRTLNMVIAAMAVLFVSVVAAVQQAPSVSNAQAGDKLFPETGKMVPAIFYQYWQTHGGLAQQGLPVTDATMEKNAADGKVYLTQYFERARFEQHPEYKGTPNEVLLGLLGVEVLKCRPVGTGGTSAKDSIGASDLKFIQRPANSYISSWTIDGYSGRASTALGTISGDLQGVDYMMIDKSNFDANNLMRFYLDTLTKAGWAVQGSFEEGRGQVLTPPDSLKGQVKKMGLHFWSDGAGAGNYNTFSIGILRTTPVGSPPDLSLFVNH